MRTLAVFASAFFIAVLLFSTGVAPASPSVVPVQAAGRDGMIFGFAFDDLNKNGIMDWGEVGIDETVICLVGHNWCDHTEWGEYMFDMLSPGTYQVELTEWPDGYFLLSPNPVTVEVPEGTSYIRVNFALSNNPDGLIRGIVFVDNDRDRLRDPLEPGLDDVQVCLVGHNWCNYTEYGEYEFDMLPPGDYTVRVQRFPKGYHPTPPRKVRLTLADDEVRSDVDFGFWRNNRRNK